MEDLLDILNGIIDNGGHFGDTPLPGSSLVLTLDQRQPVPKYYLKVLLLQI